MPQDRLIEGFKKVISEVYKPRAYFRRCFELIRQLPNNYISSVDKTSLKNIIMYTKAFVKSLFLQTFSSYGIHYLKFLIRVALKKPRRFPGAIKLAIFGYHFFKITRKNIHNRMALLDNFRNYIERILMTIRERTDCMHSLDLKTAFKELYDLSEKILPNVSRKYSLVLGLSRNYTESIISKLTEKMKDYVEIMTDYIEKHLENEDSWNLRQELYKFSNSNLHSRGKASIYSYRFTEIKAVIDKFIVKMSRIKVKKISEAPLKQ
jgi:hypothetical protein